MSVNLLSSWGFLSPPLVSSPIHTALLSHSSNKREMVTGSVLGNLYEEKNITVICGEVSVILSVILSVI